MILIRNARALLLLAATIGAGQPVHAESNLNEQRIVLVVGASGTAEYGEQFNGWAADWQSLARRANLTIETIGLDLQGDQSDRKRFQQSIQRLSEPSDEPVWIVLIGHGTFTRGIAKFNLRGPDVSATELAEWLSLIERPLVVINGSSASGPFIGQLSGDGRVVVTSTKSGTERNFSRFSEHFVKALDSTDADLDHDDEISVLEAFLSAAAETRKFYVSESRIITEHALIDDNGDGKGTPPTMFRAARAIAASADGTELDGVVASRITFPNDQRSVELTPAEAKERNEIERQLDHLRARRDQFSEAGYEQQIEPLLLRLAKIYRGAETRRETVSE